VDFSLPAHLTDVLADLDRYRITEGAEERQVRWVAGQLFGFLL
jgi:hypothetical protein